MARMCPCLYQGHLPEQLWSTNHPSMLWLLLPSLRTIVQEDLFCPLHPGTQGSPHAQLLLSGSVCAVSLPPAPQAAGRSCIPALRTAEHRFALMDTQGTPMEDAGIPNRTRLLHIHLPAVAGVYVSSLTSHLGPGVAAALPHTLLCRSPLRWSLILPFRQRSEPFVREMEPCRYSQDGLQRDLEVAALLESRGLSPTPGAASPQGWGGVGAPTSPETPREFGCSWELESGCARPDPGDPAALISGSHLPFPPLLVK